MLNYKELTKQFDEVLASFSVEDIQKWLAFDNQRTLEEEQDSLERIVAGETVLIQYDIFHISHIQDIANENIIAEDFSSNKYATAA